MLKNKKNIINRKLEEIARKIAKCRKCKEGKSGLPVVGEGDIFSKVMFVGEAPGRKEAETGRPFVGRAGKLLTELLKSIGIDRQDVYITSPVKYYPGRRTPKDSEVRHGTIHLLKQIEAINPKLIVLLGRIAHKALIGEVQITKMHRKTLKKDGRFYFSTFHPAAALRFPKIKKIMRKDFVSLKKIYSDLK